MAWSSVVQDVMRRNDLTAANLDLAGTSQANIRIIQSVSRMADLPMEKVMVNINKYGNTTAVYPAALSMDYEGN